LSWRVIRLDLAYEGTDFHGFAPQPGLRTVAGELALVLRRVTGEDVPVTAAGRTDAGVHAMGQVVSFQTQSSIGLPELKGALNALTGPDLLVHGISDADSSFDARRSALSRSYEYRVWNAPQPDLWERRRTTHVVESLDVAAMCAACDLLVGRHDFRAFYTHQAQDDLAKNTVCSVCEARWERDPQEPRLVRFSIEADAFLRYMVRTIVGSSLLVGSGRLAPEALGEMLQHRERTQAGPTAPAHGLALLSVRYPED
jgi:tRNA pseudouridine38-40 synthase